MSEAFEAKDARLDLRPPEEVMQLRRLGSFHATRLSFMRSLLRRMAREDWTVTRELFDLDVKGVGQAVYRLDMPAGSVRLFAFGHELPDEERTDRVIATRWDATFTLGELEADQATLARLAANVPLQEAGRCSPHEFVLSRANKSVRLFDHVVEALSEGRQPEAEKLLAVGYLMRTTAVYGNGKFGLSDLENTFDKGLFSRPFEAELLTVYLIREYTFDLIAHLAHVKNPDHATTLSEKSKRMLGIGNATGLGMAPFLVRHPQLIGRWIEARETAIARVLARTSAQPEKREHFFQTLARACAHLEEWHTDDPRQGPRVSTLREEMQAFRGWLETPESNPFHRAKPWATIAKTARLRLSLEGQELVMSLLLEPHGDLIDDLESCLSVKEHLTLDPTMPISRLLALIEENYGWALGRDYSDPDEQYRFWYVSADKLEPRLGERHRDPGAEIEMPLGIARDVAALHATLAGRDGDGLVAEFLLERPEFRPLIRRIQGLAACPYAEIHENLLAREVVAVDLLRCKLAIFGAAKFDPKSDRWTRITMYQGAPSLTELDGETADDWAFASFHP